MGGMDSGRRSVHVLSCLNPTWGDPEDPAAYGAYHWMMDHPPHVVAGTTPQFWIDSYRQWKDAQEQDGFR